MSERSRMTTGCDARRLGPIRVFRGDITSVKVDAIVNAANEWMLGGGGVDGAIHRAAGPQLLEACKKVPLIRTNVRCPTGEARITPGFRLPARYVIHTVGPVWRGGRSGEAALLAACYSNCMVLAAEHELQSIAFPAISCGAFRYPVEDACSIAVDTIERGLKAHPVLSTVFLVAFESHIEEAFARALSKLD
jgi:O-acetyl-ADP-ribose deacetylase (regulator of RNase III)